MSNSNDGAASPRIGTTPALGSATIAEPVTDVAVQCDGPVVARTLQLLSTGPKALSVNAAERIREQAHELLVDIVRAYSSEVAAGEVGVEGTARATMATPRSGRCPTGLLYGRIQSGKTNAMIVTAAMAIDNGFRVVVVLTSNYTELVDQTARRFRVLADEGPLVYSSNQKTGSAYDWDADAENITRHVGSHGLVVVCAKNVIHQRNLGQALQRFGAADYPALILDDEADQATPDTTTNARAQQRASAPQQSSITYRLTVESAATDQDDALREVLRHNVYLQITATPYALLLQKITSPLRPSFTRLLHPGEGYNGGEHFFAEQQLGQKPFGAPLVEVDDAESQILEAGATSAPDGLQRAIVLFLLAAAAHERRSPRTDQTGYKFLCHTSPKTVEHTRLSGLIRSFVDELSTASGAPALYQWAYEELGRSAPELPPLQDLVARVRRKLHYRRVIVVNATGSDLEFGSGPNFMVGGNILGRGLTIENLLVTYYLRRAKTTQMDTVQQHARMYGYRHDLMPYTRVFLPEILAHRFGRIHEADTALRELVQNPNTHERVVVKVAGQLRPTRPNVLDVSSIAAYRPGQQVYPIEPMYTREDLGNSTERIESLVRDACGGVLPDGGAFVEVPIDTVAEIIETVRSHDQESGDWDQAALSFVLKMLADDHDGRGLLKIREAPRRKGPRVPQGFIGGPDQAEARTQRRPVLFLTRVAGNEQSGWAGVPFWHPTLIFPSDMANWVFNVT